MPITPLGGFIGDAECRDRARHARAKAARLAELLGDRDNPTARNLIRDWTEDADYYEWILNDDN